MSRTANYFFGAGGMFFNKRPISPFNYLNDLDNDVINYFNILKYRPTELIDAFEQLPIHQTLWQECKIKSTSDEIWRAAEFLFMSNFGYLGMQETMRYSTDHSFSQTLNGMKDVLKFFNRSNCKFLCHDFRKAVDVVYRSVRDPAQLFFYADPPYIGTHGNYNSFTEKDLKDLIEVLSNTGCNFLISEFASDEVIRIAEDSLLNYQKIIERTTLKNTNTELVMFNYKVDNTLF